MSRILIINDDDQFRGMLRQTLRREGYEVMEARDGKEGIVCYRATPTDVVITVTAAARLEGKPKSAIWEAYNWRERSPHGDDPGR